MCLQESSQGLTLGVCLRLGERKTQQVLLLNQLRSSVPWVHLIYPTSTIHKPQNGPPFGPLPYLDADRPRVRSGWVWTGGCAGVGVQRGGAPQRREGGRSIQERIRSDAARPRPGESARHIWNCRFDLPSSLAVPPRGPYKERAGHWGFSGGDASCYQPGL